jgi:hypothetical protein
VRALFRSKQLAEAWWEFLSLNRAAPAAVTAQPAAFVKGQPVSSTNASARRDAASARREAANAAKQDAERRTKLRKLRSQIDELIKSNGYGWKPDEHPHS